MIEERARVAVDISQDILEIAGCGVHGLQALNSMISGRLPNPYEVKLGRKFMEVVRFDLVLGTESGLRGDVNYSASEIVSSLSRRSGGLDLGQLQVMSRQTSRVFDRNEVAVIDARNYKMFVETYYKAAIPFFPRG